MAGLLSGIEAFGLSGLNNINGIYEDGNKDEEKAEGKEVVKKSPEEIEQELIFEKTHTCPVCDLEFKERSVRVGKARLIGTDLDLRPKYEFIDLLKYDVILCPRCGYAALSRYFKFLTFPQAKLIKENISMNFKSIEYKKPIYTHEDALVRYKLTLANALVKRARTSEKAYICLKTAWVLRGMVESLDTSDAQYATKKQAVEKEEMEFLKNALDGFIAARQKESFPMCGMDETTVDYIIAVTAMKFQQYDVASKLIAGILTSNTANPRMKDKARDIKDLIMKKIRASK